MIENIILEEQGYFTCPIRNEYVLCNELDDCKECSDYQLFLEYIDYIMANPDAEDRCW